MVQLEIFGIGLVNAWKSRKFAHQYSIRNVVGEKLLRAGRVVIIQLCVFFHLFSFGNSTCPDKNMQNEMVQPGRDQVKAKMTWQFPWQLPLRLPAMQVSWCPPSEVTFWDVDRTQWNFLLLSWNQIGFQTKLIKSRANSYSWDSLPLLWSFKDFREGKADASFSRRKKRVFSWMTPDNKLLFWRHWWSRPWSWSF